MYCRCSTNDKLDGNLRLDDKHYHSSVFYIFLLRYIYTFSSFPFQVYPDDAGDVQSSAGESNFLCVCVTVQNSLDTKVIRLCDKY